MYNLVKVIFKSQKLIKLKKSCPIFFCVESETRNSNCINDILKKTLILKVLCFLKMCPIFLALFIILVGLRMS